MNCIGGSRPTYGDCVEAGQLQKTHALSEQLQKYQSGDIIHLIFNKLFSNITDFIFLSFFSFNIIVVAPQDCSNKFLRWYKILKQMNVD